MSIHLSCGKCGKSYDVPDHLAGKRVKCAQCGTSFVVEEALDELGSAEDFFASELAGAGESPFADSAASAPLYGSAAPQRDSLGRPLSSKFGHTSQTASNGLLGDLWSQHKLLLAVGVGMLLVLLSMFLTLMNSGISFRLIPAGVMLAIGVVILVGGLTAKNKRRKANVVKRRALKSLGWFFGGIMGIVMVFGGMLIGGAMGVYIPSLVHIGMPFLIVAALVAVLAAAVLAYHLLVLMFPQANVFRIGGWVYVTLTIIFPIVGFMALSATKVAIERRKAAVEAELQKQDDQRQPWEAPVSPGPPHRPQMRPHRRSGARPERPGGRRSGAERPDGSGGRESSRPHSRRPDTFRDHAFPRSAPGGRPSGAPPRDAMAGRGFNPPTPGTGRPGRIGGGGPDAGGGFESRRRQLEQQLGADKVVTVVVHNVPPGKFKQLTETIRGAVKPKPAGHSASLSGGKMRIVLGPVPDPAAFADQLTFGKVTNVDTELRMIVIEMEQPKLD